MVLISSDIPAKVLQNWGSGTVENGGSTPPHSTKESCSNRYKHQACSSMVRALDFTKRLGFESLRIFVLKDSESYLEA